MKTSKILTHKLLFIPANDDRINPEYKRFMEEERETFEALKKDSGICGLLNNCKRWGVPVESDAVRSAANFIWFMKFEKSFNETQEELSRPLLSIVKDEE